jgi:5-formyltetrahydrofolate cyclo-ligase
MTKKEARQWAKAQIAALSPEARREASSRICARLQDHLHATRPAHLGIFASLPDEPDLAPLLAHWVEQGISISCPRVEGDSLVFHRILTWKDCAPGSYQIAEPLAEAPRSDPATFDLLLVPGRAFDRHGHRLGRGKGHYDRLLERLPASTHTLGIFFACQELPELPTENHDIPLQAILNENGLVVPS